MNEFTYEAFPVLFNLALWLFLVWRSRTQIRNNIPRKGNYKLLACVVIIYSVFAFAEADTYHYQWLYEQMLTSNEPLHVENFYFRLIKLLPDNYYLWRFVIWGSATMLMIGAFKRFKLDPQTVCLVFPLVLLNAFAVTRGTLGFALMLYASSFLFFPTRNRFWSYVLGIAGICCSVFFHKSIVVFIAVFIISFIPITKLYIYLSLALFPLLYRFTPVIAIWFLQENDLSEITVESGVRYLNAEQSIANIWGVVSKCIEVAPVILILFLILRQFVFRKERIGFGYRIMMQYTFNLVYISFLLYGQELSSFLSARFLHAAYFALVIIVSYFLFGRKRSMPVKISLYLFMLYNLYILSYRFYKWD